jgi:hypothetical protein
MDSSAFLDGYMHKEAELLTVEGLAEQYREQGRALPSAEDLQKTVDDVNNRRTSQFLNSDIARTLSTSVLGAGGGAALGALFGGGRGAAYGAGIGAILGLLAKVFFGGSLDKAWNSMLHGYQKGVLKPMIEKAQKIEAQAASALPESAGYDPTQLSELAPPATSLTDPVVAPDYHQLPPAPAVSSEVSRPWTGLESIQEQSEKQAPVAPVPVVPAAAAPAASAAGEVVRPVNVGATIEQVEKELPAVSPVARPTSKTVPLSGESAEQHRQRLLAKVQERREEALRVAEAEKTQRETIGPYLLQQERQRQAGIHAARAAAGGAIKPPAETQRQEQEVQATRDRIEQDRKNKAEAVQGRSVR